MTVMKLNIYCFRYGPQNWFNYMERKHVLRFLTVLVKMKMISVNAYKSAI